MEKRQLMQDKRSVLYDCAKELFATKGFKDTGVADITQKAGVGVGTFYNYFPSKDKLFAEILKQETAALMKTILSTVNPDDEPAKLIRQFLELNLKGMQEDPILSQWYHPDVFGKIEKVFREEDGLQSMDFLYRDFIVMVEKWQQEGKMRADIRSDMIMALFGAIIRVGYHKEEIGLQYFPELQEHMTEFVLQDVIRRSV
jgi:AcrR family transcriptional regulator